MESDSNIKFNKKHGLWTTGTNSLYNLIFGAKRYFTKEILRDIKCPTLVLEGEKNNSFLVQSKKVYDGLTSLPTAIKKHIVFAEVKGAEEN